jgi:hypothetical protein
MLSAAHAQLGELESAARALKDLENLKPDYALSVRNDLEQWFDPDYVQHLIEGLRKAGINK